MKLWRLAKARYGHTSLEDEAKGAAKSGGRWNSKGVPVLYASFHISTAAMEVLVHIDWDLVPDLALVEIEVPDDISTEVVERSLLPAGWGAHPYPSVLARIGDEWVKRGEFLMLDVPSAASPYERNALINPAHPEAARCSMKVLGPYVFDGRLLSGDKDWDK
jgi:RES domain-containing protein